LLAIIENLLLLSSSLLVVVVVVVVVLGSFGWCGDGAVRWCGSAMANLSFIPTILNLHILHATTSITPVWLIVLIPTSDVNKKKKKKKRQ
jgi:hypothetical protein